MTPEEQRIAIAEACGAEWETDKFGTPLLVNKEQDAILLVRINEKDLLFSLPEYLSDLNAMHEAEQLLTEDQKTDYGWMLNQVVAADCGQAGGPYGHNLTQLASATAIQRAEAFLRTLNLWTDSP